MVAQIHKNLKNDASICLIKYEEKIKIVLLFNEGRKIEKVRMYAMWNVPQILVNSSLRSIIKFLSIVLERVTSDFNAHIIYCAVIARKYIRMVIFIYISFIYLHKTLNPDSATTALLSLELESGI